MPRTINSPGVEIRERDVSLRAPTLAGTTVFITGFADQGPTDEIVSPSSLSEFTNIYGLPTNAAERYFHHTVRAAFQSSAAILVNRLPWGSGVGEGFGSKVGVLAYPVVALSSSSTYNDTLSTGVPLNSPGHVTYVYGEPTQFNVTKEEYLAILNNETFTWSNTATSVANLSALNRLGGSGMLVFNKAQTVIDNKYRGHYVGISDNTNINPASAYDAIKYAQTVTEAAAATGITDYTVIPSARLKFALSASDASGSNPAVNSISQIMEEKVVEYDTSTRAFDDTLNIGLFKLRQSTFLTDATTLDAFVEESYNASIGYTRQIYSQTGGQPVNFFLENVINTNSPNIQVLVNPYISKQLSRVVLNDDGTPKNKIRVYTDQLVNNLGNGNILVTSAGTTHAALTAVATNLAKADSLFPIGAYSESYTSDTDTKNTGSIPSKIERSMDRIRNDEVYDIDIICEGGLGTVWAGLSGAEGFYFEDQTASGITGLRSSNPVLGDTSARDDYAAVYNKFASLASPQSEGGRGDLIFIADPIRQILVTGTDNKVLNDPSKVFTIDLYWALRHQFENVDTSYVTVPANWMKVYDDQSTTNVWVPPSGFIAALMAATDAEIGQWSAPAGFNRGTIRGIADIAFSPNQRQRDDLYKINMNPVAAFQNQGITFFGQKTMSRKPSAFDRINVRRLFLFLEKTTKKTMQYFVFEPNSVFTRSRVVNTLTPIFERVKSSDGIYDYIIICDERNNTAQVVDNNELIVDIYIKPTRTAEFITVNFIATRTDTNFEELVS
jgi:hypothetical protein